MNEREGTAGSHYGHLGLLPAQIAYWSLKDFTIQRNSCPARLCDAAEPGAGGGIRARLTI